MIDLPESYMRIVGDLLDQHVPGCKVWAFGSRTKAHAREYSDLDLAVEGEGRLEWKTLDQLQDAFSESDLPFLVDVLDWNNVSEEFQKAVEKERVKIR